MIRLFSIAMLTLLAARIGSAEMRADEPSAVQSSQEGASMDGPAVVARWQHAAAEIERVDIEFTHYLYDLVFETVRVSDGRLVCETGREHFISLTPAIDKAAVAKKERFGTPFAVLPGLSEKWISNGSRFTHLDDSKKECFTFVVRRNEAAHFPQFQPLFCLIPKNFMNSIVNGFKTVGHIGGPCPTHGDQFDVPKQSFAHRFQINISNTNEKQVYLHLTPQLPHDAAAFQSIDVMLSRETWLPDALQLPDLAGKKQTVYVFRKRRINFCPEEVQSLFEPDLTGYVVQSDELR